MFFIKWQRHSCTFTHFIIKTGVTLEFGFIDLIGHLNNFKNDDVKLLDHFKNVTFSNFVSS